MKRAWLVGCLALVAGGCALSAEERADIIEKSAALAGEKAFQITYDKLKKEGFTDEEARRVAELARAEAAELGGKLAERTTREVEEGKRSKFWGYVALGLQALLNLGLGAVKRGGVA